MGLAFHQDSAIAAIDGNLGVVIVIGVILVFFVAGGYAFSTRRGSGIGTHPETGDESTSTDAGARTNTATEENDHGGAPHDRGTK